MLVPVILCGGAGTRLWPVSRRRHPKPFAVLGGAATMFEQTVRRVEGIDDVTVPLVVGGADQQVFITEQLRQLGRAALAVLLEPVGRNTAPAIAVAALAAQRTVGADPLLLVLPADHAVQDVAAFEAAVARGRPRAEAGDLVTFGVVPRDPNTGYGYVRAQDPRDVSRVLQFAEKPDAATAAKYLTAGDYFWNSGMFLMRASAFLAELSAHAADMVPPCTAALDQGQVTDAATLLDEDAFARCRSESIDYAIMEKTDRAAVVPLDAGWSDLGSWDALHDNLETDDVGTVVRGDVVAIDVADSYLDARHGTLTAVGVRDLVVVATEDAVLVAPRGQTQRVKEVVKALEDSHPALLDAHPERPQTWGHVHDLGNVAPGVTRLVVRGTCEVSRQTGAARRVIVVRRGEARVVDGDDTTTLVAGGAMTIAADRDYTIINAARSDLVVVEIDAG